MTSDLSALLRLPPENRTAPSVCAAEPRALAHWLEQLPKANLGQSTRALFQAIGEFNAVQLPAAARFQLLELLRPAIHFVAAGLKKHYIGQPLVLPPQAQQVADLSHVLYNRLTQGYAKVALQAGEERGTPAVLIATALHRALVDINQNILRDYLLYRAPQARSWRTLHELAALSRRLGLHERSVTDPQRGASTLESAYKQSLLMGSARIYQLRQEEMALLASAVAEWAAYVRLGPAIGGQLLVDPHADQGPVYRDLLEGPVGDHWLSLDTAELVRHLTDRAAAAGEPTLGQLSPDILARLAHGWQVPGNRLSERRSATGQLEIVLGLSATHYFVSGGVDFQLLLSRKGHPRLMGKANPFLDTASATRPVAADMKRRARDIWDSPFHSERASADAAEAIEYKVRNHYETTQKAQQKYPSHTAEIVNLSAGGYCLRYPGEAGQIKTGEIVGIREGNHKKWRVGVVRWVRILQTGPQLGVELLSPAATAYGARVLNKSGPPGEHLRVLVLPALDPIGQPPTVITPRLPFRAGQKIELALDDETTRVQLVRRLRCTAAFSQFEFRRLASPSAPTLDRGGPPEVGFDNLWDTL